MYIILPILPLVSFITVLTNYGASASVFDASVPCHRKHTTQHDRNSLTMERKNSNCVVHVRQDSDNDLEALFHVVNKNAAAKTHPDPTSSANSLPMRLRKLPPSFFKQPPLDGTLSPDQDTPTGLISHSRAHSSPASLTVPTSLKAPHSLSPVVHQRSTSFDNTALLEEPAQMPPGWEMRTTPNGQRYFMK